MVAIVGLGNVGEKYSNTRHNIGFMFVKALPKSSNVVSLMPDTMMNSSGIAVKKLINTKNINLKNLYIVHDDLDLKLGEFKIQFGKGPKIHNGVNSVEDELETPDFWRIRIGVDNRDVENRIPGDKYVLENFSQEEREIINGSVIPRAIRELYKKISK